MSREEEPSLKNHVLQAITELGEKRGSTSHNILEQIKTIMRSSAKYQERDRNLTLKLQRALQYCVDHNILTHEAGRYKLGRKHDKSGKVTTAAVRIADSQDRSLERKKEQITKKRMRESSSVSTCGRSSTSRSQTSQSSRGSRRKSIKQTEGRRSRKKSKRRGGHRRKGRKRRRRSGSEAKNIKKSEDPPNAPSKQPPDQIDEKQKYEDMPSTYSSRGQHQGNRNNSSSDKEDNAYDEELLLTRASSRLRHRRNKHNAALDQDENADSEANNLDCLCNPNQPEEDDNRPQPTDDYII